MLIGDSNSHGIDGKELDPEGSIAVRSFSGLCVVSCAYALKRHKFSYPKIKRVLFSLGTNDILHGGEQHCQEDWPIHVKSLQSEAARVFPKAKLCFILPFHGLPKSSPRESKDLEEKIKTLLPKFKRYQPPFMKGKVRDDGVHLNDAGKEAYMKFLRQNFAPQKPPPKNVAAKGHDAGTANGEQFRMNRVEFPTLHQPPQEFSAPHPPPVGPVPVSYSQPRYSLDQRCQVLRDISNMATYMLGLQGHIPQPPRVDMNYMH